MDHMASELRLLRAPWSSATAARRQTEAWAALTAAGVRFERLELSDWHDVETLVNARIPGQALTLTEYQAGAIARDAEGHLLGALVGEIEPYARGVAIHVVDVAVDVSAIRRGIGTVLLGLTSQLVSDVRFVYGGCAATGAAFYQRAGFTVLQPGAPMAFPLRGAAITSSNEHFPCMFYRYF